MDKKLKTEVCVVMPRYALGDSIPFSQDRPAPFDVFSLRKYLERFELNEYTLQIVRVWNPVMYALAFDVAESKLTTMDEYVELLAHKFGCDRTVEAVSNKVNEILEKFKYEKI